MARPTQILCTDDKLRPRKAWVVPIASPHSPALWLSNAYLNANIGVGRRPGRRLQVRHVPLSGQLGSLVVLFICGSDLFIYLCAMGRNIVCGDPLCASRRQQAGQGEGPRQSRNKNLLRYINFDGTPRCNECYAASRKKDAMPVANRTRAGGGPVSEGLPEGRNGKRKQRTDELGLLADGNGVNTGKDDEDDKDGHHLDDRHDHFQKGSE